MQTKKITALFRQFQHFQKVRRKKMIMQNKSSEKFNTIVKILFPQWHLKKHQPQDKK